MTRISPADGALRTAIRQIALSFGGGREATIWIGFDNQEHVKTYHAPDTGMSAFIASSYRGKVDWKAILYIRASGDLRMKATVLLLGTNATYSLVVELDQRTTHWSRPDQQMSEVLRQLKEP